MSEPESLTLEERVLALEEALLPPVFTTPEWTDGQAAEVAADLRQKLGDAEFRHHQEIRWLPAGRPVLTPEFARALLAECVTVVKPGEVLVIRGSYWTPGQVRELNDWGRQWLEVHAPTVRILFTIGDEVAVVEAGQ